MKSKKDKLNKTFSCYTQIINEYFPKESKNALEHTKKSLSSTKLGETFASTILKTIQF